VEDSQEVYVAAEFVEPFFDEGSKELIASTIATSSKRIIVDRTKQVLYAYDDNGLYMKEKVSTGIELTPTPRGTFTIYRKTPSRYMQGPIPGVSTHYYDLPGVPWNLYFSKDGAVIHGAYWHQSFGKKWSNGCVNLPIASAEKLYKWADVGTKVIVRD
jgi:lipoprotein-anchoring transpeptidase ErfK/SrfK